MLLIAHRGASGHAPENTVAAFKRALELGAKAIELDVHLTLDRELVVAHDDDLKRCAGDKRRLRAITWADAAKLDVGSWYDKAFASERLPRLEDVYELLPPGVELHVELKHGSRIYPGIEERALELAQKREALERTVFSSFDHAALRSLRSLNAKARLGYLLGLSTLRTGLREAREIAAESLNLAVRQTTARAVKAAHERGLRVLSYTVNTSPERDRFARLGVDGIFSNYPELGL